MSAAVNKMRATWKQAREKRAAASPAPLNVLLVDKGYWNILHDIEADLQEALLEYDRAASYSGRPAARDAKAMMKVIEDLRKALQAISGREFEKAIKAENSFVAKYGTPEDYAFAQSKAMFPN